MGPLLVVPARFLYPCQKSGPGLREKGTLCKLVLVPLVILPSQVCSVCKLMLKDALNGAMTPSTSANMNSSRKTREVDLSIGEGSKESRPNWEVRVRRLQMVVPQEFSQTLAVECVFFAAVLTDLLWPCILLLYCDRSGILQKHGYDARRCLVQKPTRPLPNLLTELFLSGDGGKYRLMIRKAASPRTSFSAPPRPASDAGGMYMRLTLAGRRVLSLDGNRHPRVLGWGQRSLPPRKAVYSEFFRLGSVDWRVLLWFGAVTGTL